MRVGGGRPGGRDEGQYACDFGKERVHAIKHFFFQKVSTSLMKMTASHQEQMTT